LQGINPPNFQSAVVMFHFVDCNILAWKMIRLKDTDPISYKLMGRCGKLKLQCRKAVDLRPSSITNSKDTASR
jgi:hypothetical protein